MIKIQKLKANYGFRHSGLKQKYFVKAFFLLSLSISLKSDMVYQLYMVMENAKMFIYCTFTEDFIADLWIYLQNGV